VWAGASLPVVDKPNRFKAGNPRRDEDAGSRSTFLNLPLKEGIKPHRWRNDMEGVYFADQLWQRLIVWT
jgi:hypothetical protein